MTSSEPDVTAVEDRLCVRVRVRASWPLAQVTAAVTAACDEAAERGRTVLVLELAATPDLSREWPGDVAIQDVNRWERAVRRLERLPLVTIAAAAGACGGAALDLMLATDFRIAAEDLRIMLPINDGHFWPGMAVHRLVHQVGMSRARQIVLWGSDIPAAKALELGVIDQVHDDLVEAVNTAVVLRGHLSDQETSVRRQLLLEAAVTEHDQALGTHLAACDRELRRLNRAERTLA